MAGTFRFIEILSLLTESEAGPFIRLIAVSSSDGPPIRRTETRAKIAHREPDASVFSSKRMRSGSYSAAIDLACSGRPRRSHT